MANYTITYIVNKNDKEYSHCYADSLQRSKKIANRMVDGKYHYVKVERITEILKVVQ